MTETATSTIDEQPISIDLKNRWLAAFLAWLVPGLGHFYQGRTMKGLLFSVSILSIFFIGCWISSDPQVGAARAVYVPQTLGESRLMSYCQTLVGLPSFPAWYQSSRVQQGKPPILHGFMAPPQADPDQRIAQQTAIALAQQPSLSRCYFVLRSKFEIGLVYTLVAALLNVLAILDAFGGPVTFQKSEKSETGPVQESHSPSFFKAKREV
ncbi:MAG: hypothetical protein PHE53_00035 [Thermoguttaceae bacterium]|nr:hypothetical protein [Thermoguttaceae bacterium]